MDHTDASTTPSAIARIRSLADATWWWGVVIAVMVLAKHWPPTVRGPEAVYPQGSGSRNGHDVGSVSTGGFEARAWRPSHLNHRAAPVVELVETRAPDDGARLA